MGSYGQELIKLGLQFIGALIVARLTVTWALSRFKFEKAWERKTAALADVLSAMRDMSRVIVQWINEEIGDAQYIQSHKDDLKARYRTARRSLESVSAVAMLVLPGPIAETLAELDKALTSTHDNWLDRLEAENALIEKASDRLIAEAKGLL
jgi:hypothetical protein